MSQSSSYAEAQAWVRRRLRTQPATTIQNWITAQDRDAAQAMREAGVNPKTPEDRQKRECARKHRRWLRKLQRALLEATKPRRRPNDLWRRTRPGAWGMEAQVYAANEADRSLDAQEDQQSLEEASAESLTECPSETPKAA